MRKATKQPLNRRMIWHQYWNECFRTAKIACPYWELNSNSPAVQSWWLISHRQKQWVMKTTLCNMFTVTINIKLNVFCRQLGHSPPSQISSTLTHFALKSNITWIYEQCNIHRTQNKICEMRKQVLWIQNYCPEMHCKLIPMYTVIK
jgi:hypothetical protein